VLPNDVIVDAMIWIPKAYGRTVFISSVAITPGIVTLTFLADFNPFLPVSSSSTGPDAFTPLAVLSLVKPVTRFKNYALTPLVDGVGGWVALGAAVEEDISLNLRFSGPEATGLLDRVIRVYDVAPVTTIGKQKSAISLRGLVRLAGQAGVVRTFKTTRVIEGITRDVAAIGLDLGDDPVTVLSTFAGVCGHRPIAGNCNKTPIETIEGVGPNVDGNIDIEFLGEEVVGDVRDGIVIDFPIGISDVEPYLDSSEAGPPVVSSEEGPSSSSGPPPDEPVGSSVAGSYYCEDFESGVAEELVVRVGAFSIEEAETWPLDSSVRGPDSERYIASLGVPTSQIALDPNRDLDSNDIYAVQGIISPKTYDGNGFLVFGYETINSFMVAGLTFLKNTSYPQGIFFIGYKAATPSIFPAGIGDGIRFFSTFNPGYVLNPALRTDYYVNIEIEQLSPTVAICRFAVDWQEETYHRSFYQTVVLPNTIFNKIGWAGLGAVGAPTHFDNFGIDCPGFSSSSSSSSGP
jgi:hypothetical protein